MIIMTRRRLPPTSMWSGIWTLVIFISFVALVVGGTMLVNQYLYGDWRCAFARCVMVK